jgi:hypothetical protein
LHWQGTRCIAVGKPFTLWAMGNAGGKALPFTPSSKRADEKLNFVSTIWTIWESTDGVALIFRHDKKGARSQDTACAQNSLKRLRAMRHPFVLKFLVRLVISAAASGCTARRHDMHRPPAPCPF